MDLLRGELSAEQDEGDAPAGMGGPSAEEDVPMMGVTDRRAQKGRPGRMAGPSVKGALPRIVAGAEIGGPEARAAEDAVRLGRDAERREPSEDDLVAIMDRLR